MGISIGLGLELGWGEQRSASHMAHAKNWAAFWAMDVAVGIYIIGQLK